MELRMYLFMIIDFICIKFLPMKILDVVLKRVYRYIPSQK